MISIILKSGIKPRKLLLVWILVLMPAFSYAATTRPKITGFSVTNSATGVVGIFESLNDAAVAVCQGGILVGVDHVDSGNNIYCKIHPDPTQPDTIPYWQGTYFLIDVCPGGTGGWLHDDSRMCYDAPEKKPDCPCYGNPISLGAKEKVQTEKDYISKQGLNFIRYYSSKKFLSGIEIMGLSWGHSYSKKLRTTKPRNYAYTDPIKIFRSYGWKGIAGNGGDWYPNEFPPLQPSSVYSVIISRPNGYGYYFSSSDGGSTWHADVDGKEQLHALQFDELGNVTQWKLVTSEYEMEYYDQDGKLTSIVFPSGYTQTLFYSDGNSPVGRAPVGGLLIKVQDNFGRELNFTYDNLERIVLFVDPAGNSYAYTYDGSNALLDSVTYPDGLRRMYYYNEPSQMASQIQGARYLTGISDEISSGNFVRNGTYRYDSKGFPISTEHANGVEKYTFDYANNKVTDPLGTVRSYGFETVNGRVMKKSEVQPDGTSTSTRHDANGNVMFDYDFKNNITAYSYDMTRNLETSRTEAYGTPQARTRTTNWHPIFRLPLQIAEPKRRTTFVYDSNGNLLSKTIQATTDKTGSQGMGATLIGSPRSWSYTYNGMGQVLSATGPRTDVSDVTRYEYDASGNLVTITNAAGHVTRLSNYDANGNVGTIIDPNGVITSFAYSPRGWINTRIVSANGANETTSFEYDGVGGLTKVTMPDESTLMYNYDDAHRLTGVSDSLGNSIAYTLDNMGNRILEKVQDVNGNLSRQTARVYDVLNRLKQQTGGVQ